MRRVRSIVGGVLLLWLGTVLYPEVSTSASGHGLDGFLPQFEEGTERFINGDAALWREQASSRDDVTIMGAWGGYERGGAEVGARYSWAVARFRPSGARLDVTYLSRVVSGDLAYTVAIERSTVQLRDHDLPQPMALRVTHVFRREQGEWKLVHRHADPLMEKTAPAAVLR